MDLVLKLGLRTYVFKSVRKDDNDFKYKLTVKYVAIY